MSQSDVSWRKKMVFSSIKGPDVISTQALENTENYCLRESKIKITKCDEQKICLDAARQ